MKLPLGLTDPHSSEAAPWAEAKTNSPVQMTQCPLRLYPSQVAPSTPGPTAAPLEGMQARSHFSPSPRGHPVGQAAWLASCKTYFAGSPGSPGLLPAVSNFVLIFSNSFTSGLDGVCGPGIKGSKMERRQKELKEVSRHWIFFVE